MSRFLRVSVIVLIFVAAVLVWGEIRGSRRLQPAPDQAGVSSQQASNTSLKGVELIVTSPGLDQVVSSPLTITGEAPGYWYFEASFPVELLDASGALIAQGVATAQDEWMTEAMVPFIATLEFALGDYGQTGTLVLRKDNPSGLPENDDSMEIPVQFAP